MTEQQITEQSENKNPSNDESLKGIGGWLMLIGIGIILAPIKLAYFVYTIYRDIFANGTWSLLTNVESAYYLPNFGVMLTVESLINILLLVLSIFLIYLFFTHHKNFPKWFIGLSLFSLVFLIVDTYAVSFIFPGEQGFDSATMKEIALSIGRAGIWIPYMLVSKRVKLTFIK